MQMVDPKYETMRTARTVLRDAIEDLYQNNGTQPPGDGTAKAVHAAFLHYEGAVLQLLQDDLEAMERLAFRVAEAEKEPTNG